MKALKSAGLLAIAAAAVMVPLYGEVGGALRHPEWAHMLLRALDLEDDLPQNAPAALVFSTLSWKNTLVYPADRYLRARGVEVAGPAGARHVVAAGGDGEVAYPVAIVRAGDYRLRVEISGDPKRPGRADITPIGEAKPVREFAVVPPAAAGWIDVGGAHLDPGGYTAAVMLPPGATLQRVEVAPRCLAPIEPVGGWRERAGTTSEDVAVTVLQALDLVYELPPAADAIELVASDFRVISSSPMVATAAAEPGQDGLWLRGGTRGTRALVVVDLPEPGLYTLSTFGLPSTAQGWLVDSCRKAILCPRPGTEPGGPTWRPVLTAEFTAGRHSFEVTLPPGAGLGRVRVERKKDGPSDYVSTLARVGFDVGPSGPIARGRADAAMEFVRSRRERLRDNACGDVPPADVVEASLDPSVVQGAGVGIVAGHPVDGVGVPLPPPLAPPPITIPPVTTLPVAPTPFPTPPPTTTPSTPPSTLPPPTVPPQIPGSPVTIAPTPPPGP